MREAMRALWVVLILLCCGSTAAAESHTAELLAGLPVCWQDRAEDPQQHAARFAWIADAVDAATPSLHERAALIAIGWHESRWCSAVHAGKRKGGHGAGLWQIEPGSNRPPPYAGLSWEATLNAAQQALWLWRHSWQCGPQIPARFTAYAGAPCESELALSGWGPEARGRAQFLWWAEWRLAGAES